MSSSWLQMVNPLSYPANASGRQSDNSEFNKLLIGVLFGAASTYCVVQYMKRPTKKKLDAENCSQHTNYADREHLWPVNSKDFREGMSKLSDLIVEYIQNNQKYNVLTENKFGSVYNIMSRTMPEKGQKLDSIIKDLNNVVLPGLLHWQHPRFHGYYGSGFSYPDVMADSFISGISVIPFDWIGAPAIAEIEMAVLNWFGEAIGLSKEMLFAPDARESKGGGIISYSSSEIIYTSIMVSRYRKLNELVEYNAQDRREQQAAYLPKLIVYTNAESHSAIEKACNMALITLRPLQPNTSDFGLTGDVLERAIKQDIKLGNIPFHIHGSLGTTNTAAMDRLNELADVAEKYNCWFHVDAAYGGCAMLCPEFRQQFGRGLDRVDSLNVNIHKWPFCSAPMSFFWCCHRTDVQNTFSVHPHYLKFQFDNEEVPAFRHWGIQLTRRALCLKAWFVFQLYGLHGMQNQIRRLTRVAETMYELIKQDERFQVVGKPALTLVAFQLRMESEHESNRLTKELCEYINRSSKLFVTHAKPMGIDVIRINISYALSLENDAYESYSILKRLTDEYLKNQLEFSALRYDADDVTPIKGSPLMSTHNSFSARSPDMEM